MGLGRVLQLLAFAVYNCLLFTPTRIVHAQFEPDNWPYKSAPLRDRQWHVGVATFYGDNMVSKENTGNCGFPSDFVYSNNQAAVPNPRWTETKTRGFPSFKGAACGQCFQLTCLPKARYANKVFCRKNIINITITNFDRPGDEEWANNHFDLYKDGFAKIADPVAGRINVLFRRIPCDLRKKAKYTVTGAKYWHDLVIWDIPGAGNVLQVQVRCAGSNVWQVLKHGWGARYWLDGLCDFDNRQTIVRGLLAETKKFIYASRHY